MAKSRNKWKEYTYYLAILFIGSVALNMITIIENDNAFNTLNIKSNISPSLTINESQILVYETHAEIVYPNMSWFTLEPTGSMLPLANTGTYMLGVNVTDDNELHVGDIVTYNSESGEYIMHRIINISNDENGTYYILKGDNNPIADKNKIRLNQVVFKVVSIIY